MINIRKTALVLSMAMACAIGEATVRQSSALATTPPQSTLAQLPEENPGNSQLDDDPLSDTQSVPSEPSESSESFEPNAEPVSDPATRERIEELLAITGADTTIPILEQMIAQFRTLTPNVPDEWWDGFMEKAIATDFNALLIPIYERNYTAAEIDGLIEFYQTPLGQSLLQKAPVVAQESIAVGQAWGMEIAQELVEELEADGFVLQGGQIPTAQPEAVETEMPETEMPEVETPEAETP